MAAKKVWIEISHDIGDRVYLLTDDEQVPYLVIGLNIKHGQVITYSLSGRAGEYEAYDFEITANRQIIINKKTDEEQTED